jgi:hypothetical protein
VQASYRLPLGNERLALTFSGSGAVNWYFYQNFLNDSGRAYDWPVASKFYSMSAGLRLSNLSIKSWEAFGNGLSEQVMLRHVFEDNYKPRFESLLRGALENIHALHGIPVAENFAFKGALFGAYDMNGMNHTGRSARWSGSIFDGFAATEYRGLLYHPFKWLAGAEIEWKPWQAEIQKNVSHLYFNRVFTGLAYRLSYFGDQSRLISPDVPAGTQYLHSLMLRVNGVVSILPLTVLPVKITFTLNGGLKLSSLGDNFTTDDLFWSWDFTASY